MLPLSFAHSCFSLCGTLEGIPPVPYISLHVLLEVFSFSLQRGFSFCICTLSTFGSRKAATTATEPQATTKTTTTVEEEEAEAEVTDWLTTVAKSYWRFLFAVLLLLFWGCAKFAEAGLMNEKPATKTTSTAAAAATTAERHKAEKNVSYRVALVWSVQKNHNEKNSYFCSTLKRTAQSTPQSQCGGFFAVPLFTVALCSFCCCCFCFCCFFKFTSSLLALLLL